MPSKGKHFAARPEEEGTSSPSSSFAASHKPSSHMRYEGATQKLPRLSGVRVHAEPVAGHAGERSAESGSQNSAPDSLHASGLSGGAHFSAAAGGGVADGNGIEGNVAGAVGSADEGAVRDVAAAPADEAAAETNVVSADMADASRTVKPASSAKSVGTAKPAGKAKSAAKAPKKRSFVRSRAFTILIAAILVIAGVALIGYPYLSDYLNKVEQDKVAQTQQQVVQDTPKEDLSAYMQAAQDYNARLKEGRVRVTDPFDPNQKTTSDEEYASLLNLNGDGVMAEIVIPKINVDLPIYHGVDGSDMEHGVGHMPETSLPVGGESTHAVLAGHTGLPSAKIFDNIDQLQVGDWFIIRVLGEDHAYKVTSTEVVLPEETESLAIQDGKDLVTLVTCTPYGINTHRLLVHAERCDVPDEWLNRDKTDLPATVQHVRDNPLLALTLIGVAVGLGVIVGLLLVRRHHKRRATKAEISSVAGAAASSHVGGSRDAHTSRGAHTLSSTSREAHSRDTKPRGAHFK